METLLSCASVPHICAAYLRHDPAGEAGQQSLYPPQSEPSSGGLNAQAINRVIPAANMLVV
jgi:hypothetical protein